MRVIVEFPSGASFREMDAIRTKVFPVIKKSEMFKRLKKNGAVVEEYDGNRISLTVCDESEIG